MEMARPHLNEAWQLFAAKAEATATDEGRWLELVYCILAGTQVKVETARRVFDFAVGALQPLRHPARLAATPGAVTILATVLHDAGYRYYNGKAVAIVAAAVWLANDYDGRVSHFLSSQRDVMDMAREVQYRVKGVGRKIANHWLRNIGCDTCTIDLHLLRVFRNLGFITRDGPPREAEFNACVAALREVATALDVPLRVAQYAVWLEARKNGSAQRA